MIENDHTAAVFLHLNGQFSRSLNFNWNGIVSVTIVDTVNFELKVWKQHFTKRKFNATRSNGTSVFI